MDRRKRKNLFYPSPSYLNKRIALTTGDPEGVGKWVASQALKKLGPQKSFQFVIWTEKQAKTLNLPNFQTLVFEQYPQNLKGLFKEDRVLHIKSPGGPGDWLEKATKLCLQKKFSALVTGPVSKKAMKQNKHKALSQTALLKKLCQKKRLFMCFRGFFFNTVLLTDHIPLKKISVRKTDLKECITLSLSARKFLNKNLQNKPLGLLGLNPHSGEEGLIGMEEEKILKPLLKNFSSKEVQGPLVPDSAFFKKNWNLYSFFIALYHDQGLIPFKIIHDHKGFAQTLGLPFLRLGVDHGTGLNLKKKEISSTSFFKALKEAIRLTSLPSAF